MPPPLEFDLMLTIGLITIVLFYYFLIDAHEILSTTKEYIEFEPIGWSRSLKFKMQNRYILLIKFIKRREYSYFIIPIIISLFFIFCFCSSEPQSTQRTIFNAAITLCINSIFLGLLFHSYKDWREKRVEMERLAYEINFFRDWKTDEAMYRIVGNLKRLNSKKIDNEKIEISIPLDECYLKGANLEGMNLGGTKYGQVSLYETDLSEANLIDTEFNEYTYGLHTSNLKNAKVRDKEWFSYLRQQGVEKVNVIESRYSLEGEWINNNPMCQGADYYILKRKGIEFAKDLNEILKKQETNNEVDSNHLT